MIFSVSIPLKSGLFVIIRGDYMGSFLYRSLNPLEIGSICNMGYMRKGGADCVSIPLKSGLFVIWHISTRNKQQQSQSP